MVTAIKTRPTQAVKCRNDWSDEDEDEDDVWFDATEDIEDDNWLDTFMEEDDDDDQPVGVMRWVGGRTLPPPPPAQEGFLPRILR